MESLHPEPHVPPGLIVTIRPEGRFSVAEAGNPECEARFMTPLPVGYGRWSYPSVLVLPDGVLIAHTCTYHDEMGRRLGLKEGCNAGIKVLPLPWFYGGRDPYDNPGLLKLQEAAKP